jgi:hypothetical protein
MAAVTNTFCIQIIISPLVALLVSILVMVD